MACHVENLLAVRSPIAQGLEEIFKTGQCVCQAIHLLAIGHLATAQQLVVSELPDTDQVIGGFRNVQNAKRAGYFGEQARHFGKLGMIPVRLDKGHEGLPGLGEIDDRFFHQHFKQPARFAAGP